ncbi:hypothetical protein M2459_000282 [Parabacteroides sp. PF5-5]|uniref:RagB/SusD family nutrient uptake outer membrane protein n=1 Tax=unclassified Parabacteroides TaxID=2649774 RepID=UPI0024772B99|nr:MULTISPECIES: RagB/SusD family nutrient uptake outer membrane protein [unclassified Parabacteroides]MDH6303951.1 hypothetical protein [Parabacteroides sp. PH5-39]MDH6314567.1 hypothetical protein [Parabacteroides sp. PF5-13]MDH6318368.1 hypothetical protein [Parabacteroides sp. PH5-13]MDH6322340.1 hypothetical protein [Parabacteroides sp. PH5-8]MDH6325581.1 hypothetical protein [Parabacteroides sp. PH5-41]
MKAQHIYIICVISSLIGLSCQDFLKETPLDQIPEEEAFDNESQLYLNTVATLYNYVGGYSDNQGLSGTYRGIYDLNTFTTDEAIIPTRGGDWYDGGFWQGLYLHEWGTKSHALQATWEYLYKVIVLSNNSLEKLNNAITEANKENIEAYIAEVRAFRAMYYYYLLDLFGRVPLILSSSTPMSEVKQNERQEVFNFVVGELQAATPFLSTARSNFLGDYYGRITRPVAYFLLAKLALNAEVYTDNNWTDQAHPDGRNILFTINNQTYNTWEATKAYCDSVSSLGYQLATDYEANFSVYNETSVENIFTIPMDKHFYTNQMMYLFRSRHYNHAKAYGLGGENGSSATIEALKTFAYDTDSVDSRFDKCYYAGIVYDLNGNVVRLDNGSILAYLPWEIGLDISGTASEKTAGARMKKYAIDKNATKDGKLQDNDIVLFRYADVLLMKCEAKVRNGEDGDYELNLVRLRAGSPQRKATLENILSERQLEFAWEGWRRQDLIRFRLFTRPYSNRPQLPNEESGYTTVFPIPENILTLNKNLSQNPGY